jgi:rhodanese-related sulfurtransferase
VIQTIDRETLKKKLDNNEDFHLVEVLPEKQYNAIHIKGAINIPIKDIGREATRRFDKDDEIVVYCADIECQSSPFAAEKLDSFGFKHVYDYEAGKKDWVEAGYPVEGEDA